MVSWRRQQKVEVKQKGKLFSSEMEITTHDTREEDQLDKNGDVWEKAVPYWDCSRKKALDFHKAEVQGMTPELILCFSIWQRT